MDADSRALLPSRVEGPIDRAALDAVRNAFDAAFGERCGRCRAKGQRAGHQPGGEARKPESMPHRRAGRYSPSARFNSPVSISRAISDAPPTSVPFTNTIGNVGQPLHIFSALRLRHWPR